MWAPSIIGRISDKLVAKYRDRAIIPEHTCIAVDDAERVRVPVTEELSANDVRVESHHLQIPRVMPLVERQGAALVVVHSRRCVADYVHLTGHTERERER